MALFRPYERTAKPQAASDPSKSADRLARATQPAKGSTSKQATAKQPAATTKVGSAKPTSAKLTKAAPSDDVETETSVEQPKLPKGYTPKKGRPTPTQAEARDARMERLNPTLSDKERKRQVREARAKARYEAMDRAEQEPTKVLLRDYIDTRWTATEFLIPVMLVMLAANLATVNYPQLQMVVALIVVAMFVVWLVNFFLVWRGFKKFARERLNNPNFVGLMLYANSRMMTIRRFRRPGPRIARGTEI